MTEEYKIQVALEFVEELINLTKENEYEQFFEKHLFPVKFELERQLTNLNSHSKIKE